VVGVFPGAEGTKVRPAVVLSTELSHRSRPDLIVGLITTQPPEELTPRDCELRDWRQAGLHQPSFFRLFAVMFQQRDVRLIGRLTEFDWASVRECFRAGVRSQELGVGS